MCSNWSGRAHKIRALLITMSCLGAVIGCGPDRKKADWPDPVPATGKVTANGQPLDKASVFLAPDAGTPGQGAAGTTDSDGKFSLFTLTPDGKLREGAIPGKYRVSVSRLVRPDGTVVTPDSKEPPIMSGGTESVLPQFTNANLSKLLATVSSSGTPILLEVQLKK